jgi:hypothetical protein
MNINLRAIVFGIAVAAATTITIDTVVAAEVARPEVIRLEGIEVVAHRDVVADDGVVHLDPVVVTAHKTVR